jgi:hypothetical protein
MKAPASVALVLSLLIVGSPRAGTISTPDIIGRTASASIACMQWMPIGLCFWLECCRSRLFQTAVQAAIRTYW